MGNCLSRLTPVEGNWFCAAFFLDERRPTQEGGKLILKGGELCVKDVNGMIEERMAKHLEWCHEAPPARDLSEFYALRPITAATAAPPNIHLR